MKYTLEQIQRIQAKLKIMPVIERKNVELSRQESIRILSKEIAEMQKRGYTMEQIAQCLSGEGLAVATPTLKSYLQKSKRTTSNRKNPASAPGDTAPHAPVAVPHTTAKPSKAGIGFTATADSSDI